MVLADTSVEYSSKLTEFDISLLYWLLGESGKRYLQTNAPYRQ